MTYSILKALDAAVEKHNRPVTVDEIQPFYAYNDRKGMETTLDREFSFGRVQMRTNQQTGEYVYKNVM